MRSRDVLLALLIIVAGVAITADHRGVLPHWRQAVVDLRDLALATSEALGSSDFGPFVAGERGYRIIRQFDVAGPFPLEMNQQDAGLPPAGFERVYPPEKQVHLGATYQGAYGPVHWLPARAEPGGALDLRRYVAPSDDVVAYATAVIIAPEQMDTMLAFGSNDGGKVWVNGLLLFSRHVGRRLPNQDLLPVKLHAGRNRELLKVENWGRDWQAYLWVQDPRNRLKFAAD